MGEAGSTTGSIGEPGAGDSGDGSEGGQGEPGFGDMAGQEALPDMRDTLPTFDESYGEEGTAGAVGDASSATGEDSVAAGGTPGGSPGVEGKDQPAGAPGTRAQGGMDGVEGAGILTTAEQVAILDGQLEQSTSDFDALILEEQQRQREMERARQTTQREQPEPAGPGTGGRSPYRDDVAMGGGGSTGGGMGGASQGGGAPPDNPAIYKPPEDIPDGQDDDVVARQLREAAMREPDPAVRERLWNEYRKYKGLEVPEE